MSSSLVITLAVIGGIAWLVSILVAALRRRGPEDIPSNLAPGTTDDQMETRRLETGQKTAVFLSAFLAVSLPLYYLGEQDRQESFVEQFHEESVVRGEELVGPDGYDCFSCHGPEGSGGVANFVEKRSGISVGWTAPSLNDVLFRYTEDEVRYWVTYGRGNTPMPAWGLAGGGPMNEQQVEDVVNYLATIQISQDEAVAKFEGEYRQQQADRLANAEATVQTALRAQRQVVADIKQAPERAGIVDEFAVEARSLLEGAGSGIDTDGDGLSDAAEVGLVALGEEMVSALRVLEPVTLDPENPESVTGTDDLTTATALVDRLQRLVDSGEQPTLQPQLEAVQAAFDTGVVDPEIGISAGAAASLATIAQGVPDFEAPSEFNADTAATFVAALEEAAAADDPLPEVTQAATDARAAFDGGQDTDEDGLSSEAEGAISNQVAAAIDATTLDGVTVPSLDPTHLETSGEADAEHAATVVAGYESLSINLNVTKNNFDATLASAEAGVAYLEDAIEDQRWVIDFEGVAEAAFDGDVEKAERAVLLFNANCARCHTAGFSAGVPFTLEQGSGGFGPALWDGRPTVQFGEAAENVDDDLLVQFIINGSQQETPYGLNGFGSGRMPAFGQILSADDIVLIAQYLRGTDLTGLANQEVGG